MEGAVLQAAWLSDCDNLVSSLIAAKVYLNVDLVDEPRPAESTSCSPRVLGRPRGTQKNWGSLKQSETRRWR